MDPATDSGSPSHPAEGTDPTAEWTRELPELRGEATTLREPRPDDAGALFRHITTREVVQFLSPPPGSVEGFEKFIEWVGVERRAGRSFCYAVIPDGTTDAVGLFQVHRLDKGFAAAEWGFVLARDWWGTGLFDRCATALLDYLFGTLGVRRLEARAVADNPRANGVLRRLGAIQEGRLRRSFLLGGQYHDDVLWSILDEDWKRRRPAAL